LINHQFDQNTSNDVRKTGASVSSTVAGSIASGEESIKEVSEQSILERREKACNL